MRLDQLIADLPEPLGAIEATSVTADSRAVAPGSVFFAVAGAKADGVSFAPRAIAAGAVAVVGEREPQPPLVGAPFIRVDDARAALSRAAAGLCARQPEIIVAVTGTSGKTSVADFTRQIFASCGFQAASLGTIGVVKPSGAVYGSLTTPDPVALHKALDALAAEGVTHLAMEASSHGLDQRRLDGVRLTGGAFTNLSRDHLDYHADLDSYLDAKLRLFNALLKPGQCAVIDADGEASSKVIAACRERGLKVVSVGAMGEDVRLDAMWTQGFSLALDVTYQGVKRTIALPLAGAFQASNALVAAGLALAVGCAPDAVFAALEDLRGAPGRLERVGEVNGAPIFVDYAHKPDALEKALAALRPFAVGRLIVVFGCGGDRDAGKRPLMGRIAALGADVVIVTDDNPRSENAAAIRRQILAAAPDAIEIADRAEAIAAGVAMLEPGDLLLVAGKGHETGQIVGDKVLPFSDHRAIEAALKAPDTAKETLWSGLGLIEPLAARVSGPLPAGVRGVSIDTRTLEKDDVFFAIKGDNSNGHDYVAAAFAKGAAAAVIDEDHFDRLKGAGSLYVVRDVLDAMQGLARAARERSKARIVAVTGSVGKTSTKEALRTVLSAVGPTHASEKSYNNHWGVPLTLARLPVSAQYGVFEIGMNHAGEITPLVAQVRPHIAVVTNVAPVHLEYFDSIEAIADAKAEIFSGLVKGGVAILNRDIATFERLKAAADASPAGFVLTFGESEHADARLLGLRTERDRSHVTARVLGQEIEFELGAPGRHLAINALSVLLAARACGVELAVAAAALAEFEAPAGRGARQLLEIDGGELLLIDESYNANPASMRAALDLLAAAPLKPGGRRIAVLGDMLELGTSARQLHEELALPIENAHIDLVFTAGPMMGALHETLPASRRGAHASDAIALEAFVLDALRAGDAVMVKGSNSSRMHAVVGAMKRRFPAPSPREP